MTAPKAAAFDMHTGVQIANTNLADLPRIGSEWPGQGGRFAGIVRGQDGEPDYLLILGPEYDGELPWQQAMNWAAGFAADNHNDYTLPTCSEQTILFSNTRDQFQWDGYWSCEQFDKDADFAWMQDFNDCTHYYNRKDNERGARAVRRLVIQ